MAVGILKVMSPIGPHLQASELFRKLQLGSDHKMLHTKMMKMSIGYETRASAMSYNVSSRSCGHWEIQETS